MPGGTYKYCPECGFTNAKLKGVADRYQGKIFSELKLKADNSGNLKTWKIGEPLDGLPLDLQRRIKQGLDFGV
jgi:hypothetical protein